MKNIIFLLTILFFLFSCDITYNYEFEIPEVDYWFDSIQNIRHWVARNISYDNYACSYDNAQDPELTFFLRTGNCIDQCRLYQYLCQRFLNIEVAIYAIDYPGRIDHAIVNDGTFYDVVAHREIENPNILKQY